VARRRQNVRLKRHFSIVAHSADVVELRHGTWNPISFTLTDEAGSGNLLRLLNRLDGSLSPGEIAAAEGVPRRDLEVLIDHLEELELVEDGSSNVLDHYLDHVVPNLLPYGRSDVDRVTPTVVVGSGSVPEQVRRILTATVPDLEIELVGPDSESWKLLAARERGWLGDGLDFAERAEAFAPWRNRFVVFASGGVDPLQLTAFNRVSLHHGIPWIQAAVDGPFLLVGPTFVPRRSPCYECLESRVLMNLREAGSYQQYKRALAEGRANGTRPPIAPVVEAMLGSLTAFEALNFLLTGTTFTVGKLLAVYLPTLEFTFNEVLRLPGCPACGVVPERDDRELYFDVRTLLDLPE
jgi:bacteriocin biosynthesis cyclodehydratase domain-containing protein